MKKGLKRGERILEFTQDIWNDKYCVIVPSMVLCAYYYANEKYKFDILSSENFIDLLGAILTAVTILTGFMAALLGAIVQGRDTSPTIVRFFDIIGEKGEARFIKLLRHSMLGGFLLIALTGFLFLSDILTGAALYCTFLWVWLLVYFGASTYRFLALFLSLLLKKYRTAERKVQSYHSEAEKARFDERLRNQSSKTQEMEPRE